MHVHPQHQLLQVLCQELQVDTLPPDVVIMEIPHLPHPARGAYHCPRLHNLWDYSQSMIGKVDSMKEKIIVSSLLTLVTEP